MTDESYEESVLRKLSGKRWLEIENCYITNQPLIRSGRGKKRTVEPDKNIQPTKAFLFCWKAKRTKGGIKRKRILRVIRAAPGNIVDAVELFCSENVVIKSLNPIEYRKHIGEPDLA